jgi:hypothetical protein
VKIKNFYFLIGAVIIALPQIKAEEPVTKSKPAGISIRDNKSAVSVKTYYFHGTRRCKTCLAIESNAKKALETGFSEEMTQEVITWEAIDTDQKENKHYQKRFDLMFSSLILVKLKDGQQVEWKNLQKVWELVWDKPAFEEYVQKEMKAYLES